MALSTLNYKRGMLEDKNLNKDKKSREVRNNCYTKLAIDCKVSYFDSHTELPFNISSNKEFISSLRLNYFSPIKKTNPI